MTPQTAWLLAISAVVIVGVIAFFVGRSSAGTKGRIDELEAELARKAEEAERYRKEVDAHFDKTATLFVSMAGSYKELFEHLSAGYDKLSGASARERFQERVDALLPRRVVEPAAAGALLAGGSGGRCCGCGRRGTDGIERGCSGRARAGQRGGCGPCSGGGGSRRIRPAKRRGDFRSVCGRGGEGCSRVGRRTCRSRGTRKCWRRCGCRGARPSCRGGGRRDRRRVGRRVPRRDALSGACAGGRSGRTCPLPVRSQAPCPPVRSTVSS
ncbi:DUF1043 family protein [Thauera sp. UPWRP]|nr:DUF1043 family protein [Thauera sp. UPWRP]